MTDSELATIIAEQAHIIEKQADQIKQLSGELAQHLCAEEDENETIRIS